MKLLPVWLWESLENLPLLFGFVSAARLWRNSLFTGLAALMFGVGIGILITPFVEPKLHRSNHEVQWASMLVNFLLFVLLAIPFIYYFRAETRWMSWKTDILGGLGAGFLLTFIQSLHWPGLKSRMILHGAAMMTAFPVIMLGLRSIIQLNSWWVAMVMTTLLTIFASLIIALIDYQEIYRKSA